MDQVHTYSGEVVHMVQVFLDKGLAMYSKHCFLDKGNKAGAEPKKKKILLREKKYGLLVRERETTNLMCVSNTLFTIVELPCASK